MARFEVDALPLLTHKIAPRQFDLSYRFSHISLRDQIVRAQMVVSTLDRAGLVVAGAPAHRHDFQLLICGAGMAGLAAAKEAHDRGISFVLIEKGENVPGGVLASKAGRYVSTGMYEWPRPNHDQHDYPLATPDLLGNEPPPGATLNLRFAEPATIQDFSSHIELTMRTELDQWARNFTDLKHSAGALRSSNLVKWTHIDSSSKADLSAMLEEKVSIHGVPLNDRELPLVDLSHSDSTTSTKGFRFRYIIYAVGFASESSEYAEGKVPAEPYKNVQFWNADSIAQPSLRFHEHPRVGILGSGDGAMQDTLRCLLRTDVPHALAAWDRLMETKSRRRRLLDSPHVRTAMAKAMAADAYTTSGAIWTHENKVYEALDKVFMGIIADLMKKESRSLVRAANRLVRSDVSNVTLVNRNGYFTKAYALNRFLILLLNELLKARGSRHRGKLEILSGEVTLFQTVSSNPRGGILEIATASGIEARDFDLVIIRGGLDRAMSPTQLVGLSGRDTGRAELGRIPPPIRPV